VKLLDQLFHSRSAVVDLGWPYSTAEYPQNTAFGGQMFRKARQPGRWGLWWRVRFRMTSSSRSKRVKQAVKTWLSMAHLVLKLYDSHEHIQRVEWRQENYQDRLPYQKHATRAEAHMKEAKSVTEKWMTCGPTPSPVTRCLSVALPMPPASLQSAEDPCPQWNAPNFVCSHWRCIWKIAHGKDVDAESMWCRGINLE
jgi:hypothetical protein